MIEAPPRGEDEGAGPVVAPRSLLKGIIAPRVEETFELLRDRLKAEGVQIDSGAGMVLTGGASQLSGVREVAVRVFDRPRAHGPAPPHPAPGRRRLRPRVLRRGGGAPARRLWPARGGLRPLPHRRQAPAPQPNRRRRG